MAQAGNALYALNTRRQGKERLRDGAQAHQAVNAILAQYRVEGLIQVLVAEDYHTRMVRGYGRREDRGNRSVLWWWTRWWTARR